MNVYHACSLTPIWLKDPQCDGTEDSLVDCPNSGISGSHEMSTCDYRNTIGVICYNDGDSMNGTSSILAFES